MPTPSIQTLRTDAQQVLNLDSISAVRSVVAATLANANAGTPLNPNLTTQQLWNEFYQIVTQPKSDIESIIANQLMKFLYAPPAPGGVGANQQVIFNDGGVLAGDPDLIFNKALNKLVANNIETAAGLLVGTSATISGDLTVDTSTLKVDSTNNRVGIGTATPGNKLNVAGNSSANVEPDFQINRSSSGTTIQSGPNITFVDGTTNNTTTLQVTQGRFGVWNYGSGSWNERLSVDSSGNVGIGVTPSAGAGCLQLVSGVNFPATQVASANANTLDDYEEGTFTPAITGSTTAGTATYVGRSGKYTKVGNLVHVQIFIDWNSHTGTGDTRITGLPFTNGSNFSGAVVGYANAIAVTAGNYLSAYVDASQSWILLNQIPTGGGANATVPIDAAGALVITATYTV